MVSLAPSPGVSTRRCSPAPRSPWLLRLALVFIATLAGCQNSNPFVANQPQAPGAPTATTATAQVQELQRRLAELDTTNQQLHAQLAQQQQKANLYQQQLGLLQARLKDTAEELRKVQVAKQQAEKQISAFQASLRQRGSATLRPNNSLLRSIEPVDIPGLTVKQDGELVRIEIPADRLFRQGTSQLIVSASPLLAQVAQAIATHYPRQRVAIETHTDSGPTRTASATAHLLTAQQAVAVLDELTRRYRLPPNQLFILAMGANHPVASNATSAGRAANRRVDIVIYPETY